MKKCVIHNGYCHSCGFSEDRSAISCYFDDKIQEQAVFEKFDFAPMVPISRRRTSFTSGRSSTFFLIHFPHLIFKIGDIRHIACHYCKEPFRLTNITRDHKTPLSRGGPDVPSNIVPACSKCNNLKSNKPYKDFIRYKVK